MLKKYKLGIYIKIHRIMQKLLIGLLGQLGSLFTGTIGGIENMVMAMANNGLKAVLEYNKQGVALARQMGMSAKEAQTYTRVLITRAKELGHQYGIAAEQVLQLEQNLQNATGRGLILNNEEAERMVQINKLVGAEVSSQFTSEMMNHMGGQLGAVQGAVSKAYATAAKSGLNAAKFSEKVAKNLSLANKLSFRDGVNGIIKMTALSEKLGFNLQSVESAANKFMELDSAIESSAQLQMLGGAAGAYGSNPLTMAYEANYDPEAFTERMTKTLGGYAQFNSKTGVAEVNGMNRDFVKNIAQAMGISMDEAMSIAKKQAEVKYKESAFSREFGRISPEKRDFVLNKSYVDQETGHLMINDASGQKHDITKNGLDPKLIEELEKFDNMSEKELMETQAKSLSSIEEQVTGYLTSTSAGIAEYVQKALPTIEAAIHKIGDDVLNELVPAVGELISGFTTWIEEHKEGLTEIYNLIKGTIIPPIKWAAKNIEILIGLILGRKVLGWAMKLPFGKSSVGRTLLENILGKMGVKGAPAMASTAGGASGAAMASTTGGASGAAMAKGGATVASTAAAGAVATNTANAKPTVNPKTVVNVGGKDYRFDSRGRLEVKNGKNWETATKRVVKENKRLVQAKQLEQAYLTQPTPPTASQTVSSQAKPASSATANAANTNVAANTPKNTSKLGSIGKMGSKFLKAGGVLTAGFAAFQGISAVSSYKKTRNNLDTALENGQINQTEYDEQMAQVKTERNGAVGGAVGSVAGAAIGSVFGPLGTMAGSIIGQFAGEAIGKYCSGFFDVVGEKFAPVLESAKGAISSIGKAFKPIIDGASKAMSKVLGGLGKVFNKIWGFAEPVLTEITNIFTTFYTGLFNTISFWASFVTPVIAKITPFFKGLFNAIYDFSFGVWNIVSPIIEISFKSFKTGFKLLGGLFESIFGLLQGNTEPLKKNWNAMIDWIKELPSKLIKWVGSKLRNIFGGSAKEAVENAKNEAKAKQQSNSSVAKPKEGASESYENGGIVGGNSYFGDKVMTRTNSGEMILNGSQQANLFNFISNMSNLLGSSNILASTLSNSNDIKAKPVGDKEYIYIPNKNSDSNGVTEVTVKDINLNVNGTLKLDGGNSSRDLDIRQLLSDTAFVSQLKDLIKQSINNDINNGRFMNDIASMRGMPSQVGLWGRS